MASNEANYDWQSTKTNLLERNTHMFNNPDMSDITFTCEGSYKKFFAHKYVLGTSSVVFRVMFFGEMAESNSNVHLPDTDEASFEQFLMFIYTEKCELTGQNVVGVLYLAKKYILPSLTKKCVGFLEERLYPGNAFDILEQAIRFDEKDLVGHCWDVIKSDANRAVTSDGFKQISQTTLTSLLKRKNLSIKEVELFRAVLKWIDFQCSENNLEPTRENRRSVIGDAIYELRFFSMSQAEFAQYDLNSGLLTAEESVSIYHQFNGLDSPHLKWKLSKRNGPIRYSRFPRTRKIRRWMYRGEPDRLRFCVDQECLSLLGVRLFGDESGSQYNVTLEVKDSKVTGTYLSEGDNIPGFDVMLESPVLLKRNEMVILSAKIQGPPSVALERGMSTVKIQGVTVTFSNSLSPNNGTYTAMGQFHEIILSI